MDINLTSMERDVQTPEELRVRVADFIRENGMTQDKTAKEAGMSTAALNQWLQNKYRGDNVVMEAKLTIWLSSRERRTATVQSLPIAADYVATPSGERIKAVLTYAQMAADLAVIYGGAGVGKTKATRSYAASNPNVWISTMRPDTANVASCLEEIGEAVGTKTGSRAARLSRDICRRIEGTGGLLIIDEAQALSVPAIESIRSIHDATGVGLVLCGNESVYARFTGGSRAATFAQLFSRIGKRLRLNRPSMKDVAVLADAYHVAGAAERGALFDISQKPGALRAVTKTLRLAAMFAAGQGLPLALPHIMAAWKDLGGEA